MFELKQALNLKLQQQLVMTPQLQQAIRLLQLSRLELVDASGNVVPAPVLDLDSGAGGTGKAALSGLLPDSLYRYRLHFDGDGYSPWASKSRKTKKREA